MLSLTHKVGGKELGVGGFVGYNKDFAGTCDHVDINGAEQQLFSSSHKDISGADDFVNLGNGLGAVSHCRYRLSAAHKKDSVNARELCRGDDIRVRRAVLLRRSTHDNFLHACDFCGDRVHENRRRQRSSAAGHINADALKSAHALTHHNAV